MTNQYADIEMFGELTFAQRVARLPRVFQQRIKRLYNQHKSFSGITAIFHLIVCESAVTIAYRLKSRKRIDAFMSLSTHEKFAIIADLDSGMPTSELMRACMLAKNYVRKSKSIV